MQSMQGISFFGLGLGAVCRAFVSFWAGSLFASQIAGAEFVWERKPLREALSLHLNGLSYHLASDRSTLNEENLGIGFSHYLGRLSAESKWLDGFAVSAEADFYSDSFSDFGYLVGLSFQKEIGPYLDGGFNVGLIHEDNLEEKSGLFLHPYVFPYLQTRFEGPINARFSYVPPVETEGSFTLQLITRF